MTLINVFFRLISLPFVLIAFSIGLIRKLLWFIYEYLMYGGELAVYTKDHQAPTKAQLYDDLIDLIKKSKP